MSPRLPEYDNKLFAVSRDIKPSETIFGSLMRRGFHDFHHVYFYDFVS